MIPKRTRNTRTRSGSVLSADLIVDAAMSLVAEHYRSQLRGGSSPARAARAIDLIQQAELQTDSNVNMLFVLDNLAAQIAAG